MASGVSFILHCIMEHQFIFSATYDSQEERKDKILYPYSRQVQSTIQNDILFFWIFLRYPYTRSYQIGKEILRNKYSIIFLGKTPFFDLQ